jgi:hypothetical protein
MHLVPAPNARNGASKGHSRNIERGRIRYTLDSRTMKRAMNDEYTWLESCDPEKGPIGGFL